MRTKSILILSVFCVVFQLNAMSKNPVKIFENYKQLLRDCPYLSESARIMCRSMPPLSFFQRNARKIKKNLKKTDNLHTPREQEKKCKKDAQKFFKQVFEHSEMREIFLNTTAKTMNKGRYQHVRMTKDLSPKSLEGYCEKKQIVVPYINSAFLYSRMIHEVGHVIEQIFRANKKIEFNDEDNHEIMSIFFESLLNRQDYRPLGAERVDGIFVDFCRKGAFWWLINAITKKKLGNAASSVLTSMSIPGIKEEYIIVSQKKQRRIRQLVRSALNQFIHLKRYLGLKKYDELIGGFTREEIEEELEVGAGCFFKIKKYADQKKLETDKIIEKVHEFFKTQFFDGVCFLEEHLVGSFNAWSVIRKYYNIGRMLGNYNVFPTTISKDIDEILKKLITEKPKTPTTKKEFLGWFWGLVKGQMH